MIDYKQLKELALANVIDPTSEYWYRYVCRWFSKTFHTPLMDVYELPFNEVMLAYYEEGFEAMDEEQLEEEAMRMVNPDFDKEEEESLEDFISMLEDEIAAKTNKKAAPNKEAAQEPVKQVVKTFTDDTPEDEVGIED